MNNILQEFTLVASGNMLLTQIHILSLYIEQFNIFGKVKGDVKVNSATHNNMSCCNETIHKNILAILLLNLSILNMLIHKI